MKKYFLFVLATSMGMVAASQAKKPASGKVSPLLLKNATDSFSYALGLSMASFYKQQGVSQINTVIVNKAMNDGMKSGSTPLLSEDQINNTISNYLQKIRSQKASGNKKAGEAFLAANKTKPGIITTASGLQYQVLKKGTGPKPLSTDRIRCHYHGTLIDGTIFDSSVDKNQPIEYAVTGFITGWIEALQLMPVGSKWRLFVPSNLGYGDQGSGLIPPGAALIFDLELLDILK
jgi:FKBP-type peptidyl-prolyl cis-trans isomerase FklB